MGSSCATITKLALLDVLLDRVEELVLGDLRVRNYTSAFRASYYKILVPLIACLRTIGAGGGGVKRGGGRVKFGGGGGLTSSLALVQRGISTIMLRTVCSALAYRGMSWKGETATPSFSM